MTPNIFTRQTNTVTSFDLPSLHLLRAELKTLLHSAEAHLTQVSESGLSDNAAQVALLLDSAEQLQQAAAVLQLIDLGEAGVLAGRLAQGFNRLHAALQAGSSYDAQLISDLAEGLMMLGRYIEFVLLKETPLPSLLLPIINTLNAQLGEPAVTLDTISDNVGNRVILNQPEQHYQPIKQLDWQGLGINFSDLVRLYRAGLQVALTAQQPATSPDDLQKLAGMQAVGELLAHQSGKLFWQAANVVLTDINQALPLTNVQKRALIFIEQQLNDYLPAADSRFADLVQFANERSRHNATPQHTAYRQLVAQSQPNQAQLDKLQRFMLGPDFDTMTTLSTLIQEQIEAIKTASDNYSRESINLNDDRAEQKQAMLDGLEQLSLVFTTLNLNQASQTLARQAQAVRDWQTPTADDLDGLLFSLMVAENAAIKLAKTHTPGAAAVPLHNDSISLMQLDTAYQTLVQESRTTIAHIENALGAYLGDANHEPMHLANVPEMLMSVSGACYFLSLPQSAQLLKRTAHLLNQRLASPQPLNEAQLAHLANIVMAVDYYLASWQDNKPTGYAAIKVGQKSLQQLLAA